MSAPRIQPLPFPREPVVQSINEAIAFGAFEPPEQRRVKGATTSGPRRARSCCKRSASRARRRCTRAESKATRGRRSSRPARRQIRASAGALARVRSTGRRLLSGERPEQQAQSSERRPLAQRGRGLSSASACGTRSRTRCGRRHRVSGPAYRYCLPCNWAARGDRAGPSSSRGSGRRSP
jgi:hypothetical protein